MSEDHGNSHTKSELDSKNEKIVGPIHRQLTKEHLGGGVLLIILIEIIEGSKGHWSDPESEFLLAVIILGIACWTYAELRYKKWSRFKSITASVSLLLAISFATIFVYSLNQRLQPEVQQLSASPILNEPKLSAQGVAPMLSAPLAPTPEPTKNRLLMYSQITPKELMNQINSAPPFQRKSIANGFINTPVAWKLSVFNIIDNGSNVRIGFFVKEKDSLVPILYVWTTLPIKGNELLRATKENDIFMVKGNIAEIEGIIIALKGASIESIKD